MNDYGWFGTTPFDKNTISNKGYSSLILKNKMKNLKVIAFDADDTLFINETYFAETEQKFWLNGRLFVASKYF
jgi:hypothetical protein